jgi:NTP pyrophosphatase (non-canonical NTP hydrolase)
MVMNVTEYLLACLAEEAGEVSKEAIKCIRFTADHVAPGYSKSNLERLGKEYTELIAIKELLDEFGINIQVNPEDLIRKKIRTMHYMDISANMGTVNYTGDMLKFKK